jgi:Fe-S cluster biogenesis protein NfuA
MAKTDITDNIEKKSNDDIKILAEPSIADSKSCNFFISRLLYNGYAYFSNENEAKEFSSMAESLFGLKDVDSVLIKKNVVKLTLNNEPDWKSYIPEVESAIREQLSVDKLQVSEKYSQVDKKNFPLDVWIQEQVEAILDNEINPSLAMHGGYVKLVDIGDSKVYMEFGGGCHGCQHVRMTLKEGVEKRVRSLVPEVDEVIDITDHSTGRNPFYM